MASALATIWSVTATGTGDISSVLENISRHATLYRLGILGQVATAAGIVVLAALLHEVLGEQHRLLARIALGWWLAEAILLCVSQVGAFAAMTVAGHYAASTGARRQTLAALGEVLYDGVVQRALDLHLFFYCAGALIWFFLFLTTRAVPRWLTVWGLVAETVAFAGIVSVLSGARINILVFAHIAVLELAIGLWLAVRGVTTDSRTN